MRHSIKRISKSALSVILALMMVVSTMVVGMVTVGAASVTSDGNAILYFNRSAVSWWPATGNFVYFFNSSENKWSENATQYSGGTYYVKIPEGTWTNCILTRNSVTSDPSWKNKYNQTGDISLSSSNNYISKFSENNASATWSTIKPTSTFTLSADNTTVDAGTTVNFSTTIASNSTYNDITSNSLSVTGGSSSDYSINGTSITFNNAGTYTVKNTVTYNPKGFTSITSTADTNTVTVTVNASEYTLKTPTIVGSGSVIFTNASDSSTITTPARLASGTSVKVTATPNAGYQLDSIKLNGITISNNSTFAMPSQDSTVEVTFSLITPTVTLDPASKTVNVGESVTLTPSVTHALTPSGTYTVTKDGNSVTASDYISGNTFTTPLSADSAGTYVVTYTATVTSGSDSKSASASSTITVEQSTEQQAYNSLVTWLADSSKNPNNISGKTTSTLNAYTTAYTAAQTAVTAGYPASGTANTTALSDLQSAFTALTDKTSLVKPELTALPQYIDVTSDSKTVTLSVSNASSYPAGANVTYSFYQEGNDTALYTGANSSSTVDVATEGTFNYYVKVNLGNTDDYTCASDTSETKSVIAVTPVTVSVTAGANGSAYVSSYTTYDNQTKSNTDTALTSVKVYPGSSVTFTAVPDEGYVVGVWNTDQSSGSTTYTVSSVTAATNVTVSFSDKPEYTYALVGASTIKDSNGQAAAWNGGASTTPNQTDFDADSSLKFTNNKLVVTASSGDQFRFIGTDGSKYYHYGSANNSNETIEYGTTYNTTLGDKLVYKFNEAGTYEIEITSGTDSPLSFKVTKLATYYIGGRFKVKASEGATDYTYTATTTENSSQWNENSKMIPFTYAGDGIYKLDTYCTIAELSAQISSTDPYFLIYDGSSMYSNTSSVHKMQDHDSSSPVTLTKITDTGTGNLLLFSDTSSTDTSLVTLYLDTTGSSKKLYYVAESGKTPLVAPSIRTDIETLTLENPTATITVTPATYPEGVDVEYYLYNGDTYVAKTTGTTFTVSSAGTYTVKAYPSAVNPVYKESIASISVIIADSRIPVTLNAMNGIAGTTVAKAANTNSSVSGETSIEGGKTYTVTKGSTVTVTSTMTADTTTAEKFVYAYVVNNKDTYLATEGIAVTKDDKKYATYSATFTIAEDATETTLTVVPIYYYKACAKDGEYIKFYVDKSDTTGWGNNLYNYAYYYKKAGDTKDVYESDGIWPGQPMLYDETKQLYYSLVPKQIGGKLVSGLTVNIGSDQLQSFDFDDFKVINEIGYDIVRLDLKQRSGHTQNKVTLFGDADATAYDKGNKTFITPTYTYSNLVSDFSGRWESYKDINGNDVSLLGMAVNPENTNTTYIVSSATHDSERGQWMSAFSVYKVANDGTVTYVTTAFPSDFIPRIVKDDQTEATANTSAYNAILDAGLGDALVKIVYEDQVSTRIDGRWYYAQSDSEVSAYAYYRKYETTDCSGTPSDLLINKDYSKIIAETELINDDGIVIGGKNSTLKKEISVVSSPLAGYIFDHWSVVDKAGNIIIDKLENVGSSFTTTLDQEMHYVANFRKATQGQIEIKHSIYSGVGAKNGLGYYRLEVKVLKENGTWTSVATGSGTGANGQTVTISDLTENDKIVRIKLITETAGENTFRYWYTDSSDGTEIIEDPDGIMTCKAVDSENYIDITEPFGKNGILTYTFDTEVWKLFSGKISQLNFYSDIAPMTKNYKLTYLYDDRFGNQKSYVVTGTHDDSYYVKNENSWAPNEELIYAKAPYIDDLYKDCTWTMAQCTKDGTDATLTAVQTSKKYTVKIYDSTGEASDPYLLPINSYVYVKNVPGQFYVADPEDSNGNKFNYWSVTENGIEVTRQYQRMYTLVVLGNYVIKPVYGEEAATDAVYISKPQYTREQTKSEDGKIVTDKLYVDFMVSYMSADGSLIMNNTGKYDTGILIEFGQYRKFEENEDKTLNIDYAGKAYNSDNSKLVEAATGTASKVKYTYSGEGSIENDNRVIYKYDIDEEKYNNMNRLDYFASFVNSPGNQKYVYKAYYYVRVKNADGSYGEPIISNAVYFNLYEVGTSDPNTVNTSTT